jgi:uncharacterized membrane protein
MQRGAFGGNPGGEDNGMKNAVAETAKGAKDAAAKTASKAVASTKAVVSEAAGSAKEGVQQAANEAVIMVQPFEVLKAGATKHLHNKLVHFPIVLGLFGALFLLLSYRYPSYKWPARVLLFFGGAFGIAAMFTGEAQSAEFDGTSLGQVLEYHEDIARNCVILMWGALVLSFFEITRKFFWLYALVLIAGLILAGGLGGVLATS